MAGGRPGLPHGKPWPIDQSLESLHGIVKLPGFLISNSEIELGFVPKRPVRRSRHDLLEHFDGQWQRRTNIKPQELSFFPRKKHDPDLILALDHLFKTLALGIGFDQCLIGLVSLHIIAGLFENRPKPVLRFRGHSGFRVLLENYFELFGRLIKLLFFVKVEGIIEDVISTALSLGFGVDELPLFGRPNPIRGGKRVWKEQYKNEGKNLRDFHKSFMIFKLGKFARRYYIMGQEKLSIEMA